MSVEVKCACVVSIMSLYDDDDDVTGGTAGALGGTGWSKGATWAQQTQHKQNTIKQTLLATSISVKKDAGSAAASVPAATAATASPFPKPVSLPPVINLQKSKRAADVDTAPKFYGGGDRVLLCRFLDVLLLYLCLWVHPVSIVQIRGDKSMLPMNDPNWTVVNEYDPMWPNDYHKVVKGKC